MTWTMAAKERPRRALAVAVLSVFAAAAATSALAFANEQRSVGEILDAIERAPTRKAAAQEHLARARSAMDRATRMRTAGDETHAPQADLLAREWAEAAEDLARAADAEAKAAAARTGARTATAKAERERALLEEGIARNGRLRALLEQTTREKAAGAPSAARTSAEAALAGTKRPPGAGVDAGSAP